MVTCLTLLILVLTFVVSANTANETSRNEDLVVAIREMQTATYFSFAMLINMYTPDRIPQNITFLMPNDRMLSEVSLSENDIYSFLLRHTIPSPLLFDHLERFPTGSMIPTSEPNFMLRISNKGRKSFFLNNVQIISPNICSPPSPKAAGAPISPKGPATPASPMWPSPPLPLKSPPHQVSVTAPPTTNSKIGPKKSDSSQLLAVGLIRSIVPSVILALVTFQI